MTSRGQPKYETDHTDANLEIGLPVLYCFRRKPCTLRVPTLSRPHMSVYVEEYILISMSFKYN